MNNESEIKEMVKSKYAEIALQDKDQNLKSCCGATSCSNEMYSIMADEYSELEGYVSAADLGLGCGLPTEYANIQEGNTVVDLGSGAGNDCFVARQIVGEHGRVIGVDFTEAMIERARMNVEQLKFYNVEFRLGEIEHLPIRPNTADVVISNCVLNLVPDKSAAFAEIFRVLKPGGHFCISDIVLEGQLSPALQKVAELYAGCVSGAIQKEAYLHIIENQKFEKIQLHKQKSISIPEEILENHLTQEEMKEFKDSNVGIYSITVSATKPKTCCAPDSSCC